MKKKILALLLALSMTASLAACGLAGTTAPAESESSKPAAETPAATELSLIHI